MAKVETGSTTMATLLHEMSRGLFGLLNELVKQHVMRELGGSDEIGRI